MKKLLVLIIVVVLTLAGCGELTDGQRAYWANYFQNFEPGNVNPGYIQVLPPVFQRPQHNSTYWQEKNAEREYNEKLRNPK